MLSSIRPALRPIARAATLAAALAALTACERGTERPQGAAASATSAAAGDSLPADHPPIGGAAGGAPRSTLPPAARAALDSGNVAFRAKQYDVALTYYRAAVDAAPGSAAPFFGIYMAARATGNAALADSAMKQVKAHSPANAGMTDSAMKALHAEQQPKRPASE